MKTLAVICFVFLSLSSWAQQTGLIFSSVPELPKVLELEKRVKWDNKSEMKHIDNAHFAEVNTAFIGFDMKNLEQYMLKTNKHFSCDGDFEFRNDEHGVQYIALKSINVCLDEMGFVAVHSVGRPLLSYFDIQLIAQKIQNEKANAKTQLEINQMSGTKEIDNESNPNVLIDESTIPY